MCMDPIITNSGVTDPAFMRELHQSIYDAAILYNERPREFTARLGVIAEDASTEILNIALISTIEDLLDGRVMRFPDDAGIAGASE